MGLRYVDGQSHNLEAGEVATSTHFMALRVTGLIESCVFSPSSLIMLIGRDSYANIFSFWFYNTQDAWRQHLVWLVQTNVSSVGGITQILWERAGSGRWTILKRL